MSEEKSKVKICPICSNTEVMFAQNPLSKEPKMTPKFAPMGCLGEVCKFYNEEMKECFFYYSNGGIIKHCRKIS